MPHLLERFQDLISLEMETFQLLDLARCSRGSVRAMGFCIALAERYSNTFMEPHVSGLGEGDGGGAVKAGAVRLGL